MMKLTGQFPSKYELDAVTAGAIATCDPQDGVTGGIISDPSACSFDSFSMVGKTVDCNNGTIMISNAAATTAILTWTGPRKASGDFLYHGLDYQSRLSSTGDGITTSDLSLAMTTCSSNGTCTGLPAGFGEPWLEFMVKKDPDRDYTRISSVKEYARLFHASAQEFDSIIGTFDLDLSAFRDVGGKMITFHGMVSYNPAISFSFTGVCRVRIVSMLTWIVSKADELISSKRTNEYYDRATEQTPDVKDFFRYFQVPGLGHCAGGVRGQPTATFQALVHWVERGVIPDPLPINFKDSNGTQYERISCPYPGKVRLVSIGLDVTKADSYNCTL
jgi:hypothetical protein